MNSKPSTSPDSSTPQPSPSVLCASEHTDWSEQPTNNGKPWRYIAPHYEAQGADEIDLSPLEKLEQVPTWKRGGLLITLALVAVAIVATFLDLLFGVFETLGGQW